MATILIVDDEIDARDALCAYLTKFGHEVECVGNGRAALASILTKIPDVIVLDLLMPGIDGPSLLEIVRSYLRLRSIPVVVWTGAGTGTVVERAEQMGVDAIFSKPSATFSQIREAVEKVAQKPGR